MRANAMATPLLEEVDGELAQVWRFILEREVEAPERFQAIQSYRATMAVLRQQAVFIEQLFETGVVDEMERDELLRCPCPLFFRLTRRTYSPVGLVSCSLPANVHEKTDPF
jgi:hypothetical protein